MKRRDLVRHLEKHGCSLLREGGRHSLVAQPITKSQISSSSTHRNQ